MKKLLILGAALLGLCTLGHTARAGGDDRDDSYERRSYEHRSYERSREYDRSSDDCEPRHVYRGCYLPPLPVFCPPVPRILFYGRPHYHRHYYPRGYGYGYGPGVHIGIGF